MPRPTPTTWFTKPITIEEVKSLKGRALTDRIQSEVHMLKQLFCEAVQTSTINAVTVNPAAFAKPDLVQEAYQVFAAELAAEGFEVSLGTIQNSRVIYEVRISWS